MISISSATALVKAYLDRADCPSRISAVTPLDFGWIFSYDSIAFLDRAQESARLLGNGPIIVDHAGTMLFTSSAEPLEDYIEAYRLGIRHQMCAFVLTRIHSPETTLHHLLRHQFKTVVPETDQYGTTWRIPRPFSEAELKAKISNLPATFPESIGFSLPVARWLAQLRATNCCEFILEPESAVTAHNFA